MVYSPLKKVMYRCPHCKGDIEIGKDYWHCTLCRRKFEVRRGVPILNVGSGSARGFIWADEPHTFLDTVEQKGWQTALENVQKPNSPNKLQEAIAPNRLGFKFLFDLDRSWKVLDIGAGTGGVACQLAKECFVVALDKSWYDAIFMHLRAQQEGLYEFEVVSADAIALPFVSNQFDLTIMIGSLEWVPTSWPGKEARLVQLKAVREAYRVLKPGGNLFLGIENRYFLGYFLGIPEPHTNLKYISLLKREKAEALSQDLRGSSYLELTHSKDDYIKLLKEAGFEKIETFWLYPNYRTPHYIIPLDKPKIIKFFVDNLLDPREFGGKEYCLYQFYQFLDPIMIANHIRDFGFLGCRPKK